MTILEKLLGRRDDVKKMDAANYSETVRHFASINAEPDDTDWNLAIEAITYAGKTSEQFDRDVQLHKRLAEIEVELAEVEALREQENAATKAVVDHLEAMRQREKNDHAELIRLRGVAGSFRVGDRSRDLRFERLQIEKTINPPAETPRAVDLPGTSFIPAADVTKAAPMLGVRIDS